MIQTFRDGTDSDYSSSDSREYRPYRAKSCMHTRIRAQYQHSWAKPMWLSHSRRNRLGSDLISGSWCECSLWVGIRLVILAAVVTMEHLNYACHP